MMYGKASKSNCHAKGSGSMKKGGKPSFANPRAHGSGSMKGSGPGKITKQIAKTQRL